MSLSVSAITGALSSTFGGIVSGATTIVKIIASVTFAVLFAGAIASFLGHLERIIATSIVGEVFGIIGCCLPFQASVVFGGLLTVANAIVVFLVAKKSYELVQGLIGVSH